MLLGYIVFIVCLIPSCVRLLYLLFFEKRLSPSIFLITSCFFNNRLKSSRYVKCIVVSASEYIHVLALLHDANLFYICELTNGLNYTGQCLLQIR